MKSLQNVVKQITDLTVNNETNYPEYYSFLDENRITIPSTTHPEIGINIMEEYLESLKYFLKEYIKIHKRT